MNLRIHRTTATGKELLDIKDASENIAYAVLRRFLPEKKDELTVDPIQLHVQPDVTLQASAPETTSADQPSSEADDQPMNHPSVIVPPRILGRDVARTIIQQAQSAARQEVQTTVQEPVKEQPKYYPPTMVQKNGMDLYTVEVMCGACGHEGSRLTAPTNLFVKCRACDQKLTVEPMYDEPLAADKAGFAFKANAPFIHYREQKVLREEMAAERQAQ
ncbi:hypothetical protein QK289_04155 [Exiguobacterium antarcticum]|uniref:Uncharacterized protein n=1 Tax=Exiguobacterium antarcticum TaxID=132920 RepID=A0ABT6R1K0_9BACL|nr:hypothetical protein [Exiguobacterium antarcticum]MDI3234191.1 hypothetical protein [Exiguobacterium antarcticum]